MPRRKLCYFNKKKECCHSDGRYCSYAGPCDEYINYFARSSYEMEGVTYMAGDLVMTDGINDTKKGIPYVIKSIQPMNTFKFIEKEVVRDVAYLDKLEHDDKFIPFGTWTKHIIPISLTPQILERNGWKKEYSIGNEDRYVNYNFLHVTFHYNDNTIKVWVNGLTLLNGIKYVNELQHLLFGLKLNLGFKV